MNQLLGNALLGFQFGILSLLLLLFTYVPLHFSDPSFPDSLGLWVSNLVIRSRVTFYFDKRAKNSFDARSWFCRRRVRYGKRVQERHALDWGRVWRHERCVELDVPWIELSPVDEHAAE